MFWRAATELKFMFIERTLPVCMNGGKLFRQRPAVKLLW